MMFMSSCQGLSGKLILSVATELSLLKSVAKYTNGLILVSTNRASFGL